MIKSKFAKVFVLSMCLTVLSTAAVYAAESRGGQSGSAGGNAATSTAAEGSGTAASSPVAANPEISEKLLQKQKEIDLYLFDKYREDIEKKGITITHTVPAGDCIELGILPLNQENSDYLYGILGKDGIKLVDGQKAGIMPAVAPDIAPAEEPADIGQGDQPVSSGDVNTQIYTTTAIAEDGAATVANSGDGREIALMAEDGRAVLYGAPAAGDVPDAAKNRWGIITPLSLAAAAAAIAAITGFAMLRKRKTTQN